MRISDWSSDVCSSDLEVAKLCAAFPGPYWQAKDRARAYPSEFVAALGKAGYLAALIPEEYGGAGLPLSAVAAIPEAIQPQGCHGGAVHAQMYVMGPLLRHGSGRTAGRPVGEGWGSTCSSHRS